MSIDLDQVERQTQRALAEMSSGATRPASASEMRVVLDLVAEVRAARENAYELAAKQADELAAENRRSAAAVREYKLENTAIEHDEWADAAETVARQLRRRAG